MSLAPPLRTFARLIISGLLVATASAGFAEETVEIDAGSCKIKVPTGVMADLTSGGHQVWIGECKDGFAHGSGKFYRIRDDLVEGLANQTRELGERKSSDYYTFKQGTKEIIRITAGLKSPADGRYPVAKAAVPEWVAGALGKPLQGYPSILRNPQLDDGVPVVRDVALEGIRNFFSQNIFKGVSEEDAYKKTINSGMLHYYVGFVETYPKTAKRAEIEAKVKQFKKALVGRGRAEVVLSDDVLRKQYNWNGESSTSPWTDRGGAMIRIPPEPIWEGDLTYGNLLLHGTFRLKSDGLHIYRLSSIIYPTQPPLTKQK